MKLVLTCEHAFNTIPKEYRYLFMDSGSVLESHRGYDPGAFDLFRELVPLSDHSEYQKTGRLLVEVNRSLKHPFLFSEFTKHLPRQEKEKILKNFYFPYRNSVEQSISEFIRNGEQVLHLSVHSFTPFFNEMLRNADIGILYDPSRKNEKETGKEFKRRLQQNLPDLRIRFNYPYLGKADGFTTYLRRMFPDHYTGIELEVNQEFVTRNKMNRAIKKAVKTALNNLL
ncbi:N-formylglutamate amidohydrolase [Salegentibacter chungangensis]|uniref:N-formylglutamate amidohydrolase n=1 Tax=Salegentibacter chungangensis TaxID=1335724 RepID=A0ABW3NSC1_9FLAO